MLKGGEKISSGSIWILAGLAEEGKPSALTMELLGLAQDLALELESEINVLLLSDSISPAKDELSVFADRLFVVEDENFREYNPEIYLATLKDIIQNYAGNDERLLLLAGHNDVGQDLLPRLAFSLEAGLVTDCTGVTVDKENKDFVFERFIYGGNALACQNVLANFAMATVRSRVGEKPSPKAEKAEPISPEVKLPESLSVELKGKELVSKEMALEDAPVIISGGRGIGSEEGFTRLFELAQLLNGAVGATRPPVDAGWVSSTRQVGITGKIVAPQVYIAVALSGSTQHLSGMSEAGTIISINKDPEAYIFKVSDIGVVANWEEVFPYFIEELKTIIEGR